MPSHHIYSETAPLEAVILHTPGPEVENMTPQNAERALYSDILNLNVAMREYEQFREVLKKFSTVYEVRDLLSGILENTEVRKELTSTICRNEMAGNLSSCLADLSTRELSRQLIEGVVMKKDNLTKFLSKERYALRPLHNFFFTRDSAITIFDKVLIGRMASVVREREALIMEAIFEHHPAFSTTALNPTRHPLFQPETTIEGGDILVAREDVILTGIGARTTSQGVDFLIERLKKQDAKRHILVQELPLKPESFIHLDMVFTFIDDHHCMVYDPVILKPNKLQTVHIEVDNGKVTRIREEENLLKALNHLGFDLKPLFCGGSSDPWVQEREQWHSGANFLALAPGVVIGYGRNTHTMEELSNNGFNIIKAEEIINGNIPPHGLRQTVITIEGSELARGGGGARCMSMPVKRLSQG